ncbi:MAG: DUF928 domain-containing protein [Cyanobacteria bacterium P01_A01_bin.84]
MNKIKSILNISILSTTTFINLVSFPPQSVDAQTLDTQTLNTQTVASIINLWNKIFKPVGDPEPPIKPKKGGGRPGEALCLISPDKPKVTRTIWNTKPFFLWKGKISKIAIAAKGSEEYLNTQIVTGTQSVNYTGEPLKPGKTYEWSIFLSDQKNATSTMFVPFKVMEAPQRNRITAELRLLERLQKNNGADSEKIALAKTRYFTQKGLWSDALQEAHSVPNPSPKLLQILKDLPNQLCNS